MASSSFYSSSSSAGYHQGEKYLVFISFRGADVRYGFLSHVVAALRRKQIKAFMDDTDLQRGNEITPTLLKVIEQSKISIVIFSKDYPNSPWCLDELEKILDCKEKRKQIVVPVFYQVDPSDIQELKGNYVIAYHSPRFPASKVENWKRALVEISQLSGFDSQNSKSKPEANLCDEIANDVDKKLSDLFPFNMHKDGLFGIDSRLEDVELLIEPDANGVRTVGIWGMGGIGKTTLADKVFNKIKNKFDGHSFVPSVREKLIKTFSTDVRDDIIREVLGEKDIKIGSPHSIDDSIWRRLKDRKVLIVLDDVDNCSQLKSLLEDSGLCSPGMFGSGSRIIVTSRDKQVLENVNMEKHIYQAKELSDDDALQLFSWHSFRQCYPQEEYKELSGKAVRYCHGLPLALVVLGSELKGKRTREWEDALADFNSTPHVDIQKILRISFDGLSRNQKSIFLDIACLFKGDSIEDVERILECFGFHARNGIDRLCDKSLITNYKGKIEMHDLVQQMGQEIVVEQSGEKHENQSRLWTYNDIRDVLENDGGTENVEAISLKRYKFDASIEISSKAFLHMRKLRFLQVINLSTFWNRVRLPKGLEFLPNSLKYLEWEYFPCSNLLSNFNLENLVELDMPNSQLKQLIWNKPLRNLKRICLEDSKCLITISDLAKAPNLEVINLRHCWSLVHIGSSTENLKKLTTLDLHDCKRLSQLPEISGSEEELNLCESGIRQLPLTIGHHWSLQSVLNISCCTKLNKLPEHLGNLRSLENLNASESGLKELPSSICNMRSLKNLDISYCRKLNKLPEHLGNLRSLEKLNASGSGLEELSSSICNMRSLTSLYISNCEYLNKLPEHLGNLQSLENLKASRSGLEELPSSICNMRSLTSLDISFCGKLNKLPEHLGNLQSLKYLIAWGSGLEELPSSICNMRSLMDLYISFCKKLNKLPEHLGNLQSLKYLIGWGSGLEELPSSICNMRSLTSFDISNCEYLNKLPEHLGNLQSLENLKASRSGLEELPSSICNMRSLTSLDISYCGKLNKLPEHLGNLQSLKYLIACASGLEELPSSICNMRSLTDLYISNCKKLNKLPEHLGNLQSLKNLKASRSGLEELPSSICNMRFLTSLDISNCEYLNKLPKPLGNLQSLKNLYASGSGLEELPSSICNMRSLTNLDIPYYERLNKLPEYFGNLESLEKLDASKSGLKELPSSIQHLRKLEFLDLRECKKLESLLYLPSNLKELYAANCTSLKSVSATFKFPCIILDLSNCQKLNEGASLIAQQISWETHYLSAVKRKCTSLCLVGSEVPQWMKYRNDRGSSLSLELDAHGSSIHAIFCVVVAANGCHDFDLACLSLGVSLTDERRRTRVYCLDLTDFPPIYVINSKAVIYIFRRIFMKTEL